MPTTPKGYRYPSPTQPVSETHTRIQELANDVNAKLVTKIEVGVTTATTDGIGVITITHAGIGGVRPTQVDAVAENLGAVVTSVTATTFNVQVFDKTFTNTQNNVSQTVRWTATWA